MGVTTTGSSSVPRLQELPQRVALVGLDVDPHVRQPQPGGPVAQGQRRGRHLLAQDFHAPGRGAKPEYLSPGHERSKDEIGQLRILRHEATEVRTWHPVQHGGRRRAGGEVSQLGRSTSSARRGTDPVPA